MIRSRPDAPFTSTGECSIALCRLSLGAHNPYSYNDAIVEDMGLAYLAGATRAAGQRAVVLDAELMGWTDRQLQDEIADVNPSVVGLTLLGPEFERAVALMQAIREASASPPLFVAGDHLATLFPAQLLSAGFDLVFIGEAERTLPRVLTNLVQSRGLSLNPWRTGAVHVRDRTIESSPDDCLVDLDASPRAVRDALIRCLPLHPPPYQDGGLKVNIIGSRGCDGHCSFCSIAAYSRAAGIMPRWRGRSPTAIREEMEWVAREFGITDFIFFDDNFVGPPSEENRRRLEQIADELKRSSVPFQFSFSCRPDSFSPSDLPILRRLKEAGLRLIFLGIEAGDPQQLRTLGKAINPVDTARVVGMLDSLGLSLSMGFIMYTPFSTPMQLQENARYLRLLHQDHLVRNFAHRLRLYPGIPILHRIERHDLLVGRGTFEYDWEFANPDLAPVADSMSTLLMGEGGRTDHLFDEVQDLIDFGLGRPQFDHRGLRRHYRSRLFYLRNECGRRLSHHYTDLLNRPADTAIDTLVRFMKTLREDLGILAAELIGIVHSHAYRDAYFRPKEPDGVREF